MLILISAIIAYFQYHYKIRSGVFSKLTKIALSILRFFLIFFVSALFLDFYFRYIRNEYIKPTLVLAIDNSQSMISVKDSQQVKDFFHSKLEELKNNLEDKFDIQTISFGEKNHFNPDSILFNEYKTNAENIFYEAQQTLGNKPINAMLMITDGIFNEGVHPVSLAENIDYPIYVIASGDTNVYSDISVKKVIHNKNVFIGNDFIAEVILNVSKVKEEKVKISIFENKTKIAEQEININSEQQVVIPVQFQLHASQGGYHTYKVTVSHIKQEKNFQNNTAYFVVHVIENKIKVLCLYSAPHPDISAIRQSLRVSEQYETDAYYDTEFNKNINDYDVIIYHSPLTNSLMYNKCIKSNIPLMIITTDLNAVKNVLLNVTQYIPQQMNEIETNLNLNFTTFTIHDEYKEISNSLPIILAPYGNYSPKGEYDILYHQKIHNVSTELPLFFFTHNLANKYAVFLGDGLWRWRMVNYQLKQNTDWFNHLIMQTIRYLAIRKNRNPFRVQIPTTINENEPLQVIAELTNETMQNITDPDVFLILEDSTKHQYKYVFNKSTSNYFLNVGTLPAGDYKYKAYTQYKSKEYTHTGKIYVLPMSLEKNNLTAQHHLLKALSNKTDGKFYYINNDVNIISNDILNDEEIKTTVTQSESYQYWIDNKYLFLCIILLAFSEWIIRRWHGII